MSKQQKRTTPGTGDISVASRGSPPASLAKRDPLEHGLAGASRKSKPAKPAGEESWAGAFKAIGLRSFTHGKFGLFCYTALVALLLWKLPSDQIVPLLQQILNAPLFALGGWICFVLLALFGGAFVRWMRRQYTDEIERIGREKSLLQEKRLAVDVSHSGKQD